MSLGDHELPTAALIGIVAGVAYLIRYASHRHKPFSAIDALIVAAIMVIVTAIAAPLVNSANQNARTTALLQNLRTLRNQIECYKAEHGGQLPLLFRGSFPQLVEATNAGGIPGPPGRAFPLGPYLPGGVPINPFTGTNTVRLAETFPPTAATGGGWLYHQSTGRIAADFEPYLAE